MLPTLCTLGNLLSGFGAIFIASRPTQSNLPWDWTPLTFAAALIFVGMIFDVLDGRIARMTRNTSDLGGQLDSMADMVTFGVAPAFIAVQLVGIQMPFLSERGDFYLDRITLLIAAIYVACAALRLARFNVETGKDDDHMSFKGLPSPGAAGTIASLTLLHQHFLAHGSTYVSRWWMQASSLTLVAIMLLTAFAMVGRLRYVHVMNRYVRGRARFGSLAMGVVVVLLLLTAPQASVAAVFVVYAVSAPLVFLWRRLAGSSPPPAGPSAAAADVAGTSSAP